MHRAIVFLLAVFTAVVLAEGQYYVPRAYYTIDSDGHASIPVPLRRLRRSYNPGLATAHANANANANAWGGGSATANADANARAYGNGAWALPSFGSGEYGASNPKVIRH